MSPSWPLMTTPRYPLVGIASRELFHTQGLLSPMSPQHGIRVRITSQKAYSGGLFVLDANAMP